MNNLPFGYVASANSSKAQTGITTATDLTGLTVTFTAVANRRYMFIGSVNAYGTVGQWANIFLVVNGAGVRNFRSAFGQTNGFNTETYQHIFTTTAGSCTVKLQMARESAGSAVVNNYADGSYLCNITILDMGIS
jgi:hypothetical protein